MRRCGELIVLVLVSGLGACGSGSTPNARDAAVWQQTQPFAPQLCTSGNPGDATCPINHVTVSPADPSPNLSQLDLVVQQSAHEWSLTHMLLHANTDGLFVENPRFTNCQGPSGAGFANIDLAPGAQQMLADQTIPAAQDLCIAFDHIGAYMP